MDYEEDTYSLIFSAMRHPIRRRIIRELHERPASYSAILKSLGVETGHLNYHLDALKELLAKDENGSYHLSEFGSAAFELISKVEAPLVARSQFNTIRSSARLIRLMAAAIILLVLGNSVALYMFRDAQLSTASALSEEASEARSLLFQSLLVFNSTLSRGNLIEVPLDTLTVDLIRLSGKLDAMSRIDEDRSRDWVSIREGITDLSDFSYSLARRTSISTVTENEGWQRVSVGQRFYLEKVVSDLRIIYGSVDGFVFDPASVSLTGAVEAANRLRIDVASARGSFGFGQPLYGG